MLLYEKLLEASPMSDKANASWLQDQATGQGSAISDDGSTSGILQKG